jgi:membrane fusion protein, multidrug efflux system
VLAVLGVAAWIAIREYSKAQAANAKPKGTPAAQVVATVAHQGDIPVYFNGLGAVTPIYTITIKSRVDGQIMKVNYIEGQMVHQGQSLVEIDPRPYEVQLTQAEGQLVRDKALLDNALIDLNRYETLIKKNAVAEQIYATQKSTVAQDEGNVRTDQGNIDSAKLNLVYCHITAPITGRAGLRLVDPGNLVQAAGATPLVVITQTEPISVIFTINEDQVPAVLKRMKAGQHLKVEAWDRDLKNFLANGELTTLDNEIDQTTGTLKLRATFANKDEMLFPNQFVNAKLLEEEKKNVTLVSNAAIQRNGSSTFLYVVPADNKVEVRTVKIGTAGADESEVVSDNVKPGDVLVTQGVDKLQDGSLVQATIQQPGNAQTNAASGANNAPASSAQGNTSGTTHGGHRNNSAGGSSQNGANSHP